MSTGFITGLDAINYALDGMGESRIEAAQMSTKHIARNYLTLLNEVLRIFYNANVNWGFLKSKYSLSTVIGTQFYNLTSLQSNLLIDRIFRDEVTDANNNALQHISYEQYVNYTLPNFQFTDPPLSGGSVSIPSGDPSMWFENANLNDTTGKTFGLYPIPTRVQTITIPYRIALIDPITATTVTNDLLIPNADINAIILGCRWKFAQRLERPSDYIQLKRSFFLLFCLNMLNIILISPLKISKSFFEIFFFYYCQARRFLF